MLIEIINTRKTNKDLVEICKKIAGKINFDDLMNYRKVEKFGRNLKSQVDKYVDHEYGFDKINIFSNQCAFIFTISDYKKIELEDLFSTRYTKLSNTYKAKDSMSFKVDNNVLLGLYRLYGNQHLRVAINGNYFDKLKSQIENIIKLYDTNYEFKLSTDDVSLHITNLTFRIDMKRTMVNVVALQIDDKLDHKVNTYKFLDTTSINEIVKYAKSRLQ